MMSDKQTKTTKTTIKNKKLIIKIAQASINSINILKEQSVKLTPLYKKIVDDGFFKVIVISIMNVIEVKKITVKMKTF